MADETLIDDIPDFALERIGAIRELLMDLAYLDREFGNLLATLSLPENRETLRTNRDALDDVFRMVDTISAHRRKTLGKFKA